MISDDREAWSAMGSAFSGIYSPLIALLALVILGGQARAQAAMDKHQYDQTYIKGNRDDIDFFVQRLENYLDEQGEDGLCPRLVLRQFAALSKEELCSDQGQEVSRIFYEKNRKVVDIWIALYPLLVGMGSQKEFPYEHNYTSSILKMTTVLSIESCVALDKVYYSINPDKEKCDLKFWV